MSQRIIATILAAMGGDVSFLNPKPLTEREKRMRSPCKCGSGFSYGSCGFLKKCEQNKKEAGE